TDFEKRLAEKGAELAYLSRRKFTVAGFTAALMNSASVFVQAYEEARRALEREAKERRKDTRAQSADRHSDQSASQYKEDDLDTAETQDESDSDPATTDRKREGSKKRSRLRMTVLGGVVCAGAATAQIFTPEIVESVARPPARPVIAMVADPDVEDQLYTNLDCIVPTGIRFEQDYTGWLRSAACTEDTQSFLAVPPSDADIQTLRLTADRLEGAYAAGSSSTLAGVNFAGLLRRGLPSRGKTGGTNAVQSFVEAALALDDPTHVQKFSVMFSVADMVLNEPEEKIDRLVSMMPVCGGRGAPVGSLLGGQLCKKLMFPDLNMAPLELWQGCVLMSGARRPVLVTSDLAAELLQTQAANRLAVRKGPARSCLTDVAKDIGLDRDDYLRQLRALNAYQVPTIEAAGLPANPMRWIGAYAPGAKEALKDAVMLHGPVPFDAAPLESSLDVSAQKLVHQRFQAGLSARVAPKLSDEVCLSGCDDPINTLVAVGEVTAAGALPLLSISASDPGLLYGSVELSGAFGAPTRSAGSAGKLGGVTCSVIHTPRTSFCSDKRFNLHDNGVPGQDCSQPEHHHSRRHILGASRNSAHASMMSAIPQSDLKACLQDLGAVVRDDRHNYDNSLAVGATTGSTVIWRPAHLMRLAGAIATGSAELPTMLDHQFDADTSTLDLEEMLTARELAEIRKLADAPSAEPYGTVAGFSIPGCTTDVIKTGTSDAEEPSTEVRDKLLVWSGQCQSRQMVAIVMVGTRSPYLPLGDVTSRDMAALLSEAVTTTVNETTNSLNLQGGSQ
ncbi:MAG: hypothetical protein K0U61_01060, partial [Alphaproteobacteria bacterium]|nr:hypothetical protein [Alphaproteobacteria bacterium]